MSTAMPIEVLLKRCVKRVRREWGKRAAGIPDKKRMIHGYLRQFYETLFSRSTWIGMLGFLLSIFSGQVHDVMLNLKVDYRMFSALLASIVAIMVLFVFGGWEAQKQYRWKRRRFRSPFIVGILEGYLDFKRQGKECRSKFCDKTLSEWYDAFASRVVDERKLFCVEKLYWKNTSNKYAVVINPFGERYVEEDNRSMTTYNRIKDFISEGGIFVCTGGFPFYYRWDSVAGRGIDTTPRTIKVVGNKIAEASWFNESLVAKDFGVVFRNIPDEPTPTSVHQNKEDVELFGDIRSEGGNNVLEFRSPWDDSVGIIPGLRTIHDGREAYPLAAVSYGEGYLIISGMYVKTDSEFRKIVRAVENLVVTLGERHMHH